MNSNSQQPVIIVCEPGNPAEVERLRDIIGDDLNIAIEHDIHRAAEVESALIVFKGRGRAEVENETMELLKKRKILGIGRGAARLFKELGLEIRHGRAAHNSGKLGQPSLRVMKGWEHLTETKVFKTYREENIGQFGLHIPPEGDVAEHVEPILRYADKQAYAPVVKQGNYILSGARENSAVWSYEYKNFFRNLVRWLIESPFEPFETVEWDTTPVGTYDVKLPFPGRYVNSKRYHFQFKQPTRFKATLNCDEPISGWIIFMGYNREQWMRENLRSDTEVFIKADISQADIDSVGDRTWYWSLTSFGQMPANCRVNFEYGTEQLRKIVTADTSKEREHSVTNISISPASPAVLKSGQRVEFSFDYKTTAGEGVRIWGRPYRDGSRARSYIAHQSSNYSAGTGSGEGYFYFTGENNIDQIHIKMVDENTRQILTETVEPVNFTWEKSPPHPERKPEPEPKKTPDQLELADFREGELPAGAAVAADSPVGRLTLDEVLLREVIEEFSPVDYRSYVRLKMDRLAVDVGFIGSGLNSISLPLTMWTPDYPTLYFKRMSPLTKISTIYWESIRDLESGDTVEMLPAFMAQGLRPLNFPGRINFRQRLAELPEKVELKGTYLHLLPVSIEGYLISAEDDLPWQTTDEDYILRRGEENKFIVSPDPEGEILGLVGFSEQGKRIYGWSSYQYNPELKDHLQVQFSSEVDRLLVVKMNDFSVEKIPFLITAEINQMEIPLQEGYKFTLGDQDFLLEEIYISSESDTSLTKIVSSEKKRNLHGKIGYNSEGRPIGTRRSRRGSSREKEWEFRVEHVWTDLISSLKVLHIDNVDIQSGQHTTAGKLLDKEDRIKAYEKGFVQIKNYSIDSGPNQFSIKIEVDTENIEGPRYLMAVFNHQHQESPGFVGDFIQTVGPKRSTVVFSYQGADREGWEKPHIEGFRLFSPGEKQVNPVVLHLEDFSHSFDPLTLYDEERPADTDVNTVKIKELKWDHYTPSAVLDVSYRSDHGQEIFLAVTLTKSSPLELRNLQDVALFGLRKLINSEGEIELSFNPNLPWQGEKIKNLGPEDLSYLTIMLFTADQFSTGTGPGTPFFKKTIKTDDIW